MNEQHWEFLRSFPVFPTDIAVDVSMRWETHKQENLKDSQLAMLDHHCVGCRTSASFIIRDAVWPVWLMTPSSVRLWPFGKEKEREYHSLFTPRGYVRPMSVFVTACQKTNPLLRLCLTLRQRVRTVTFFSKSGTKDQRLKLDRTIEFTNGNEKTRAWPIIIPL